MTPTDLEPAQIAFCASVLHYDAGDWSPGEPEAPRVSLQGKSYSLRETCDLVKTDNRELPDDVAAMLFEAMHGDRRLTQKLGEAATYAVGSECFAEILENRVRKFQQQQQQ